MSGPALIVLGTASLILLSKNELYRVVVVEPGVESKVGAEIDSEAAASIESEGASAIEPEAEAGEEPGGIED